MTIQNAPREAIVRRPLLTAILDPANLTSRIEVKQIEFKPGQVTGLHLHPCPVTGYIAKGTVSFQVEGEPVKTLKAGDSFCNPRGSVHSIVSADSGDSTVFSTWIVDKGKPMSTPVP